MRIAFLLIIALASAADSRWVSPRAPRAIGGYGPTEQWPGDKIVYRDMTNAEFYRAEIKKILDSMRKKK